jgi:hypothetical protein
MRAARVRRATIPTSSARSSSRASARLTGAQPYFAANLRGSRAGFRPLGGVLQLARGHHYAGGSARGRWRARSAERALLGRGQRGLGLRRLVHARGLCHGISAFHRVGAGIRRAAVFRGLRPERERSRLDAAILRQGRARRANWGECGAGRCIITPGTRAGGEPRIGMPGKGDALRFDDRQYYEILHEAEPDGFVHHQPVGVMGEADPQHHVKLVVDEWGAWYAPGTEPFAEALLGQQSTMRDAVLAGLTLDTFNRHADKVGMAECGATGELSAIALLRARRQVLRHAHLSCVRYVPRRTRGRNRCARCSPLRRFRIGAPIPSSSWPC